MSYSPQGQGDGGVRKAYSEILKYTGLFGGVQVFNVLISILRNKCAAVFIGTLGIGLTDILNRTSDFFGAMTNLGISFSGTRKISEDYNTHDDEKIRDAVCTIRAWSVGTGLLGMTLCMVLSPFVSKYVFGDETLVPAFLTIAPIIAMLTVYGGESAVMKGTRKLKELAAVSALSSLLTLLITIPIYMTMGLRGVPMALLLSTSALTITTLLITHKLYPWTAKIFSRKYFHAGKALLLLGVAYLASGIAGSGAEMAVRAFISNVGSKADVGLYASGFVLCVTYTRLVFIAMDADYFPRLSAIGADSAKRDLTVCRQIDVCVLLMTPMIIAFLVFLPLIIRVLYTADFIPVVGMCVAASGYLFLKAIVTPLEYIPLANNNSALYFVMELMYDVVFVVLLVAGYSAFGLKGAGWALTCTYALDLVVVLFVFGRKYKLRLARQTVRVIITQGCLLVPVIVALLLCDTMAVRCACGVLLAASAVYSAKKLNVSWQSVTALVKRKLKK